MISSTFQFASPFFLLLIPLYPLLHYAIRSQHRQVAALYSSVELFNGIPGTFRTKLHFLPSWIRFIGFCLLVVALARPQWVAQTTEVIGQGVAILLTIDTSGSMKALDFHLQGSEANRLDVVKSVVDDFIMKRPHDRIGMVVFGEEAYTQCPLTTDKDTLRQFLQWIRIGIVGDGTAIGNALAVSVKRLQKQTEKSRIIILLTDGRSNAGQISPEIGAEMARAMGIKVYAIAVGSNKPVPYPEETPFGVRRIYARLEMDEESLRHIADVTGGKYFQATQTEELQRIYDEIDRLEKSEIKVKAYQEYEELYAGFLGVGALMLLLEILLSRTVFMKLP